jgi:hypothetical protein
VKELVRLPGVFGGGEVAPTNKVLVVGGVERIDARVEDPFYKELLLAVDDNLRSGVLVLTGVTFLVWFKEGHVERRVDAHSVGEVETEGKGRRSRVDDGEGAEETLIKLGCLALRLDVLCTDVDLIANLEGRSILDMSIVEAGVTCLSSLEVVDEVRAKLKALSIEFVDSLDCSRERVVEGRARVDAVARLEGGEPSRGLSSVVVDELGLCKAGT